MGLLNGSKFLIQGIKPAHVTSSTPSHDVVAAAIVLAGTNFKVGVSVFFHDSAGVIRTCTSIVRNSSTQIHCSMPAAAATGAGYLRVQNRDGGMGTVAFTIDP